MKKFKLIFIAALSMLALVLSAFSVSAAGEGVTITAAQVDNEENDGNLYVTATVTNNNSYPIFGKDVVVSIEASGDSAPLLIDTDSLAFDRIEAGESADILLTFTAVAEAETEAPGKTSGGCSSSFGAWSLVALCAVAVVILALGKGNLKKSGIFMLALVLCIPAFCAPASAEEAESLPSVTITKALVLGEEETYRQIGFYAEISDGTHYELKTSVSILSGGKSFTANISADYSEAEITEMGMRAVPVSGVNTLPISVQKGKEVDLTKTYGTDIELWEVNGQQNFTAVYPERIYTSDYSIKFTAVAYIRYSLRGEEGVAYSGSLSASIKTAAKELIAEEGISEEEKTDLTDKVLLKADKKAVITDEEEEQLRMKIVEKMAEMASVEWKPKKTVTTDGQLNYSTPVYAANKPYRGLIYNQQGYGTAECFSYLIGEDGYLDASMTESVKALWKTCPGVSCSTAVTGAIAYFCYGIKGSVGSTNMNPSKTGYGFTKVGSYKVPSGTTATGDILAANTEQEMAAAYAQLKVSDLLVANWYNSSNSLLGHVVMVTEAPNVIYNSDGTINLDRSTVKTIEQCATVSVVDGYLTTWPRKTLTFRTMMTSKTLKYVPVQYTSLVSEYMEPLFLMASDINTGSIVKDGLKGTIESNFPVRWTGVTVTDTAGNTVYDVKLTPSTGYSKAVLLLSLTDANAALKALPTGTYTVKITACAKDTEKVLYEGTETK